MGCWGRNENNDKEQNGVRPKGDRIMKGVYMLENKPEAKTAGFTAKDLWGESDVMSSKEGSRDIGNLTHGKDQTRKPRYTPPPSLFVKPFNTENKLDLFTDFMELGLEPKENDMKDLMILFDAIKKETGLKTDANTFSTFFPTLCASLDGRLPKNQLSLLQSLECQAGREEYGGNEVAEGRVAMVLGAGPCGLRLAMELQMLGARTIVVEKREDMTRNNVLRLWPFVMEDLKRLGVRKLYQKLDLGDINHISIRMLQIILLKISLLLGVEVRVAETFKSVKEPEGQRGWQVVTERGGLENDQHCDMLFCATGSKVALEGFSKRKPDFKMAIAITANFKKGICGEKQVEEIAGLTRQNQVEYFNLLEKDHGIGLENIVYFKDLTNYFVMTAKKESLLTNGVLKEELDKDNLLSEGNKDTEALKKFALKAAIYSTELNPLKKSAQLQCVMEDMVDVSMFNFSELYSSNQASRVIERKGHQLLQGLVGDSLMQPFWPEGLGISRGFLSVFDMAWMVRQLYLDTDETQEKVLEVIKEREKLYSLQKTADNKLQSNYQRWSIDPATRYPSASLGTTFTKDVGSQYDKDLPCSDIDIIVAEEVDRERTI